MSLLIYTLKNLTTAFLILIKSLKIDDAPTHPPPPPSPHISDIDIYIYFEPYNNFKQRHDVRVLCSLAVTGKLFFLYMSQS